MDKAAVVAEFNEFDNGDGLLAYTDGGVGENGVAGWGFVIYDRSGVTLHEQYGQVETDVHSDKWLGARKKTNNTGELTAAAEMMIWYNIWGHQLSQGGLEWRFDSMLTAQTVIGSQVAKENLELIDTVKCLFRGGVATELTARHVFSHTGVCVGNATADLLADHGQKGRTSRVGRYAHYALKGQQQVAWAKHFAETEGDAEWEKAAKTTTPLEQDFKEVVECIISAAESIPKVKAAKEVERLYKTAEIERIQRERAETGMAKLKRKERRRLDQRLTRACAKLYQDEFDEKVDRLDDVMKKNDSRSMGRIVKSLSGKRRATRKSPEYRMKVKEDGSLAKDGIFTCLGEKMANWCVFMTDRFADKKVEVPAWVVDSNQRDERTDQRCSRFTRVEFERCVALAKLGKAVGADEVPAEAVKWSDTVKDEVWAFLVKVWEQETVPASVVQGVFVMLHKKGSVNDLWNYRPVCLLSHIFKILSALILLKMNEYIAKVLPGSQCGFRAGMGYRDCTTTLREMVDRAHRLGGKITVMIVLMDLKDAFSTVVHSFLMAALKFADVPAKLRRLIECIYKVATGRVREKGADGVDVFSEPFNIDRGILQGDIMSPILFILGFAIIFMAVKFQKEGMKMSEKLCVENLEYADDAAFVFQMAVKLLEEEEAETVKPAGNLFPKPKGRVPKGSNGLPKRWDGVMGKWESGSWGRRCQRRPQMTSCRSW